MKLKRFWHQNLQWLLFIWCICSLILRPGWIIFFAGVLGWVAILYLTAPGVFWTYFGMLSPSSRFDAAKSARQLQKALEKKPLIPQPYINLGILYAREKKWAEAIPLFEEARKLSTKRDMAETLVILGIAYRENGQPETALKILDQAVAAGMKTAKVYLNYALTYMKLNRLPEAQEAAAKARSCNLNATEPVLVMGRIHFAQGDYESAKDDYEWAVAHTSWPVESYYWLGRAELELGQTEAAVEHLRKAVERITEDPLLSDVPAFEASVWLEKAEKALTPVDPGTAK